MLKDTLPISAVNVDDYDAVWVAGGGGPLLTFKDDTALHALIAAFYEKSKIVTLICYGSSLLFVDPPPLLLRIAEMSAGSCPSREHP
ncbi:MULTISPECIES: DJ-1/PfpI family protein [Sphingobium]|uniref:DJ-1/PfpI family protein n=1 Tax=Sphingobium TaxID=165695 RepID=UPI000876B1D2|nr:MULTISPECIES: DJ-1/PfpI family protein [Sphingobium]WDA38389.1 DJ-1/PfpI family protein [Sphingobium sp. YC-XJ3]SCW95490.1 DJ-1/PfpI family protein [Sphingobium faniae]